MLRKIETYKSCNGYEDEKCIQTRRQLSTTLTPTFSIFTLIVSACAFHNSVLFNFSRKNTSGNKQKYVEVGETNWQKKDGN